MENRSTYLLRFWNLRRHFFSGSRIELTAITLIGLLYIGFFLSATPFDRVQDMSLYGAFPDNRLGGLEHERLSGMLLPIRIGLGLDDQRRGYDHIPTWNPYLGGGTPLINDAFNYLFNPFASLPVLIWAGAQGTKVSIMIALLLAGYNAWALAKVIGLGGVARVMAGALYMMSGGIAAKFHTGHFQLGLSLAWVPLVLVGLWWTLNSHDRRAPVLTAVAFALLFFSGNIYYSLHVIICSVVILAIHLFKRDDSHSRRDRLKRVVIAGAFTLGLAMIQFMPVWSVRDFVEHEDVRFNAATGQLDSQYDMPQAVVNFIYPWESWAIFDDTPPFVTNVVVDYAYVGPTVFLFIAGMAVVVLSGRETYRGLGKPALAALLLALILTTWGAAQTPIVAYLYSKIPLLAEFRYVGRAHAVAALWWIVLAAVAVDMLWRAARTLLNTPAHFDPYDRTRLIRAILVATIAWVYFFVYSVGDNSTRLLMVLSNQGLYNFLNERVFTTFPQAAGVLWLSILIAFAVDALLMLIHRIFIPGAQVTMRVLARMFSTRLLCFVLMVFVLTAVADVMQVNSRLFSFGPPIHNFGRLYAYTRTSDSLASFPSIYLPFSPSAFDAYDVEMRNWGINEGWSPIGLPSIIPPGAPALPAVPQWAIVSNEYSGAFPQFVEEREHIQIQCILKFPLQNVEDPCDLSQHEGSILYQLPQSLSYAFIVPEVTLLRHADTINNANTYPVQTLSHEQDTITIRAETPEIPAEAPFYLIVQETPFPGWQAFIDGVPVAVQPVAHMAALAMLPGTHTYVLRFQPPGLSIGVVVSLATLIVMGLYLKGKQT